MMPQRWSGLVALCLMLGICLGRYIQDHHHHTLSEAMIVLLTMMSGAVAAGLAGLAAWLGWKGFWRGSVGLIMLAVAALGVAVIFHADYERKALVAPSVGIHHFSAFVEQIEMMHGNRHRLYLRSTDSIESESGEPVSGLLRLILPSHIESRYGPVLAGDRLELEASLKPPLPQLLPGGFDFTRHAREQEIVATGFIRIIADHQPGAGFSLANWRFGIQQAAAEQLPPRLAAVAAALLVGLRGQIDADLREVFRASGLAHLLAISGLHIGLFCVGMMVLMRLVFALMPQFSSRYPARQLAVLVALPAGFSYLLLSGMPVSATRAFLMLSLMMLAILLGRRVMSLNTPHLSAIVILLINPGSLFGPAFQMSFAAVYALISCWMVFARFRPSQYHGIGYRLLAYPFGIAAASLVASLATMPFALHHFGLTTAWSVIANMLGLPLMSFVIMPAGVIALLLYPFGLEAAGFLIMGYGLELLLWVAEIIAVLPAARLAVQPPSGVVLLLLTIGFFIGVIMLSRGWLVMFGAVMFAAGLWALQPQPVAAIIKPYSSLRAGFISESGSMLVSSRRLSSFEQSILMRPLARSESLFVADAEEMRCIYGYCLGRMEGGVSLAIVWSRRLLSKACHEAMLVITTVSATYPCRGESILIDKELLDRVGGVLVYSEAGTAGVGLRFVTVSGRRLNSGE